MFICDEFKNKQRKPILSFIYFHSKVHFRSHAQVKPPMGTSTSFKCWPMAKHCILELPVVMPPSLGAGGIMFSGCPSVRLKPEIPSFDLYMSPLVHPTNRNRFTTCPSVRPERFPGICRRMHAVIGLKFYMLMYLDHLQNWLVYVCGL